MPARRRLATVAVVVSLATLSWGVPAGAEPPDPTDPVAALVAATAGPIEVERQNGLVTALAAADGSPVLEADGRTARSAVAGVLREHGGAFGLGGGSTAAIESTVPTAGGATVVRAVQEVDEVPVFGGEIVTVVDESRDVLSVDAATTRSVRHLGDPRITQQEAVDVARRATASEHAVAPGSLEASPVGLRVYDPSVVGVTGPAVSLLVWEVEVGDGRQVRQTVLVDAERGAVALQFDTVAHALSRWVCDQQGRATQAERDDVPVCSTPASQAGSSGRAAKRASDHLAEVADTYASLGGIDLTDVVGDDTSGTRSLTATVNWCVTDADGCPFRNAFWDGRQVVFGQYFERADDVVAHELTHGFVQRTSNLMYLQQSGAINESMADVIGEVVDHQHDTDDDSAWTIGEDLVAGGIRSMREPGRDGMPDTMTSPDWSSEAWDDGDSGAVHHNLGVGNRTAYLVAQAIDASDPLLTKTGTLYLAVIPRLTSGAQYADLGRVLVTTCRQLVDDRVAGFASRDCGGVEAAVAATELDAPPSDSAASLGEVSSGCAPDVATTLLGRDDDGVNTFFDDLPVGPADRVRPGDRLQWARSGAESYLLMDPGPDRVGAVVTSQAFRLPATGDSVQLRFDHAHAFGRSSGALADGGRVVAERLTGGRWEAVSGLQWHNGPRQQLTIGGQTFAGFAGDSRGWGSSRLDLSPLAGQTVRFQFEVLGDSRPSPFGWWIDDVELYACPGLRTAPATPGVTSPTPAPTQAPTPAPTQAPTAVPVQPAAPATPVVRRAVTATLTSSVPRTRPGKAVVVRGRAVVRGSATAVGGVRMTLQQRVAGSARWATVSTRTTDRAGATRWTVKPRRTTAYRVQVAAGATTTATTSAPRTVALAPRRR